MFRKSYLLGIFLIPLSVINAQISAPGVVLHEGNISEQISFLPNGAGNVTGEIQTGQNNVADGVYFGGFYWNAVSLYNYNGSGQQQIVLFPIAGTDAPDSSVPEPFAVGSMNDNLFVPYNNVELAVWGEELWIISWDGSGISSLVFFAPLTENTNWDASNPQGQPFFVTNPESSSNFKQTGNTFINGLSAEIVEGDLYIFTWNGTQEDGYTIGVTYSAESGDFGGTHYISLGGQLNYTGLFDTHVFVAPDNAGIPGVANGEVNVLFAAISENCGAGGNQNMLLGAIPDYELNSATSFPGLETAYLYQTGLFTADLFTAFALRISEGACDYNAVQESGVPGVTMAIFGIVPEAPHYPWFIATAPLHYTFNPSTDTNRIPAWSYPGQGSIPSQGPNFAFSLGVQRVLQSGGNVQDYTMFSTMSQLSTSGASVGQFQAASANYFVPLDPTAIDTSSPATQTDAEQYSEAWTLLGVIHGPPPAAYNSDPFNNTSVTFDWSTSSSNTNSVTVSQSNSTTVSFAAQGSTPYFDVKLEKGSTFMDVTSTSTQNEITISDNSGGHTLNAISGNTQDEVLNEGFLIYLMPQFNNQAYQTYSFRGNNLGEVTFLSWIGSTTLQPVKYTITDTGTASLFNSEFTLNLATGMANTPSVVDVPAWTSIPASSSSANVFTAPQTTYSEGNAISPAASITYTSQNTGKSTNETSTTNTDTGSVTVGYGKPGIGSWGFDVGLSITGSSTATFSQSTTTTKQFNSGISFEMNEILVTDPVSAGSYSSVTVTPVLIFPDNPGDGDWIPSANSGDHPFLVTWMASAEPVPDNPSDLRYTAYWGESFSAEEDENVLYIPFLDRWIYNAFFPWSYDYKNEDWRYFPVQFTPAEGMWFWSESEGWLFTTEALFPWYFNVSAGEWFYDR